MTNRVHGPRPRRDVAHGMITAAPARTTPASRSASASVARPSSDVEEELIGLRVAVATGRAPRAETAHRPGDARGPGPARLWVSRLALRARQVVRHVGDDRVATAEEAKLQPQAGLVVVQLLPPVARP